MSFPSSFVLQRLQALEQELAVMSARTVASSQHQTSGARRAARIAANLEAHGQLQALAAAVADINPHVLAGDHLGAAESLSDLALRAVRLVVLDELTVLRAVVGGAAARGRDRALFRRPLASLGALDCFVRTELHRVTLLCTAFRGTRRDAYRAALRAAHVSLHQLGGETAVGQFLRVGRARGDWPDLQDVCTRMLAALAIRIDVDPDLPLLIIESAAVQMPGRSIAESTS